jgi:nitrite reductase/ring-hydroxylating ferredoxin subunit
MSDRLPAGNRAPLRAIADMGALDAPAKKLGKLARTVIKPGPMKDALSGTWLGHALHPLLTDVAIGTWTSAVLLDWVGGRRSGEAAERLIAVGLLSTAPIVASGYSDWADSEVGDDEVRRIGVVHAASNLVASSLFAASLAARRRGSSGRLLALAGAGALGAGGYLGGHLAFADGVGVDQTTFETGSDGEWIDVLADADLPADQPRCAEADGTPVMLVRQGGEVYALSNRCSHRGGPLHEGKLGDGTITCPWHTSVFALADGGLVHGPAAYPQPAWDVRVREGRIEVSRQ